MNKYDKQASDNLRMVRTNKRVTQTSLAASVGVTFQQMQKYEYGINRISVGRLVEISKVLKVSPMKIIGDIK